MVNDSVINKVKTLVKDKTQELELINGYDNSIIGVSINDNVIYSREKMVYEDACDENECEIDEIDEDALMLSDEHIEAIIRYNSYNSNKNKPLIMYESVEEMMGDDFDVEDLKKYLLEHYNEDYDAYDLGDYYECIIGFNDGSYYYDYNKVITNIMKTQFCDIKKAEEYFNKNILDIIKDVDEDIRPTFVKKI